jgi:UDP-glucuronate 4-epimerase
MMPDFNTYLITGGAGFIGSHLAKNLLEKGSRIYIIDNFNDFYDVNIKERNISDLRSCYPGLTVFRAEITNKHALQTIFETIGPELAKSGAIIHLAARAGVRPSIAEPELYQHTNVLGTFYLAELAKQYGIEKFVFASSSSVYGERSSQNNEHGFSETDDVSRPVSPYAATKLMGENMLYTYSYLSALKVVALRFFTVYGPAQRPDLAIHKFTRLIVQGNPITVFGDGSARRDFTYIDDIIQGILAAISFEDFAKTPFEVFNLGESTTTSVKELITLLEDEIGKSAIIQYHEPHPADVSITFANIQKARRQLHYKPKILPAEGIKRFIAWYRQLNVSSAETLNLPV